MKLHTIITKKQIAVLSIVGIAILGAVSIPILSSASGPTVTQGTTTTYGVLGGTTVTNTGATTISGSAGGDVGLSPGTSYTGNTTVTRSGVDHITDGAAASAQADLVVAYDSLGAPTATTLAAPDLAGQTILPGTYSTVVGTFSNSGALILDAGGDATAKFIFQTASTLITSPNSTMTLANGAQACNVFWRVGSSATVGVSSTFVGNIYALTSITANTSATIYGQLLARNGAVTLDQNTIVNNSCVTPTPTTPAAPVVAPVIPQDSSISSISSTECTTTTDYTAYIAGYFPSKVVNVAVNGTNIPASRWTQTIGQIAVTIPASSNKSSTIEIYNGRQPLLATQVFLCIEPAMILPTPVPVTETEVGGELPVTATNDYNYLLIGAGAVLLGLIGLAVRRRVRT
jgi:LPXTG-motif cell wall-anchored protein